jgi:Tol biopolymer transport system component
MRQRLTLVALATAIATIALSGPASAVLPGTNGRILFASGRGAPNDATAKLYIRPVLSSVGGGTASPVLGATGAGQHRHPTWSPDRTKIAFAQGDNATANYDIYILDLTNPTATPVNITNSNNVTDDRPAWSPDGTKIAFESENADASGQINIKMYDVASGQITDFTSTAAGFEHKPAWTPDSQTLYYTIGDPAGSNMDIVKQSLAGGGPSNVLADPAANEFQPSISPDGTHMCFTRDTGAGFNATARVRAALANGGGQMELPGNAGVPGYNCTYSPDGTKIAYVQGTFSSGDLVMENSDPTAPISLITLENTAGRFDGNPDWAPDGRPQCQDSTVTTTVGKSISIPLDCEDTGPLYEHTDLKGLVGDSPTNGTVAPEDPQDLPASVTYTPNAGFKGTDSFTVRSFDEFAFGDRTGTVTIQVRARNDFTIGKAKRNKKKGTAKLSVEVPGAGTVSLAKSKKVKASSVKAKGPGTVKLKVKPTKKTKEKLAKKGKAKVKAVVTFAPDGGDPNTKSKPVKLKLK